MTSPLQSPSLQHELGEKSVDRAFPCAPAFTPITSLPKTSWSFLSGHLPESHLLWEIFGISPTCLTFHHCCEPRYYYGPPLLCAPVLLFFGEPFSYRTWPSSERADSQGQRLHLPAGYLEAKSGKFKTPNM